MKAISLFSGMGGDTLGMKNAGVDVVGYSEINKNARDTHDANFDCKLIGNGNIIETTDEELSEYNDVDIIFAGFPCQGFSHAGKKLPDDPRNSLFREFLRAAKVINPKIIVGENVRGLLTRKTATGELYIDVIVAEFEKLGYDVRYGIIRAEECGVPQKRERLFIVGTKHTNPITITEKKGVPYIDINKEKPVGLRSILEFTVDGAKVVPFDFDSLPEGKIVSDMENDDAPHSNHPYLDLKTSKSVDHYYDADRDAYVYGNKAFSHLFSFAKRDSPIHCEIVDIDKPTKTLICTYSSQPRLFVPVENKRGKFVRMFTVDELKQIQSFPADFVMKGTKTAQITQIGNAVAPKVCEKLFSVLIND